MARIATLRMSRTAKIVHAFFANLRGKMRFLLLDAIARHVVPIGSGGAALQNLKALIGGNGVTRQQVPQFIERYNLRPEIPQMAEKVGIFKRKNHRIPDKTRTQIPFASRLALPVFGIEAVGEF